MERLQNDAAEEIAVRERQVAFCLGLAEAAEPHLDGLGQTLWMDRLERDHDNLRAAMP
jgi:hypothetical protein